MSDKEKRKPTLLIVEDDEEIRSQMKWALAEDYEVALAEDRPSAVQAVKEHHPAITTLDLGLPPSPGDVTEGMATLRDILEVDPEIKAIVVTGQGERENALNAIEEGAYDFFAKPIDIDELKVVLHRAAYLRELERENKRLRNGHRKEDSFEGMLGTSLPMQRVFTAIRKVAGSDAPVLVQGESGTGKELTAKAIHAQSQRKDGLFVPINCGAIPENLLESELFGHEKGAFTGAHAQRPGQFEMAKGGTLFLDEVGELPLSLQVKLLRFLQDGNIQRVGGRKEIAVDARILAATNVDLQEAQQEGTFREDLYYRLAVVIIDVPPLRERDEDLILLAKSFLKKYAAEQGKKQTAFSAQALRAIQKYTWPGNVRELENRVRRAAIMSESGKISLSDLGLDSSYARFSGMGLREAREALEREFIERALMRNRGNMSRTSEELQISRPTLYEMIEKLNIKR